MSAEPTLYDLVQFALKLDPKLSPQEAVARAQALFSAADEALRADEIADEQWNKQLMDEAERFALVGLDLFDDKIGMSEAFQIAAEIAGRRRVPSYKTERGFVAAMRKARLTVCTSITSQMLREWITSDDPEMPIGERREVTSVRAVEELFNQKAEQTRKGDRERKKSAESAAAKSAPKEICKKTSRNFPSKKRNTKTEKRNRNGKKRK